MIIDLIYGVGIFLFIMLIFFGLYKIDKKRKEKKQDIKNIDEEKQDVSENKSQLTSNRIKIKLYRDAGGGTVGLAGKFYANEVQDDNNNTFAVNTNHGFKENLEFTRDRIYDFIGIDLKLRGQKTKEKARNVLNEIKKQEQLLQEIEENNELNAKYNFPDEELRLKQLRVYYDTLRRSNEGSYLTWEENGIRTYCFKIVDGILYPYWWDNKKMRLDPDRTIKKKIYTHEKIVYNAENEINNRRTNWVGIIMICAGLILIFGGLFMNWKFYKNDADMALDINRGAISCQQTLASCTNAYDKLKQNEIQCLLNQSKNNINEQKQKSNIDLTPS